MQEPLKIGTMLARTFTVEQKHCIRFGEIEVLATPHLLWELEHTALELLIPYLSPGEISLGVGLDLQHRSPAIVGDSIECLARVIHREGRRVNFQIAATCSGDVVSQGTHQRQIVTSQKLLERLRSRALSNRTSE